MKNIILQVLCISGIICTNYAQNEPVNDNPEGTREVVIQPRLFGTKSTTTYTNVVLATVAVYSSCVKFISAPILKCGGKRRFKRSKIGQYDKKSIDLPQMNGDSFDLDSSARQLAGNEEEIIRKKKFLGITVWTTAGTTTTVTIKTTNTATTLSLTYACVAGNINYPKYSCLIG